ncbi:MAG TPA: condensation domain-containing protein, partial [Longimicrobiaceae bacterium]|nr:condensation domain-containing protein [Longimicrobiaceae bacterium]
MLDRLAQLSPERRLLLQKILQEKAAARQDPREIHPVPRDGALPLSFAQRRLWFLHQLDPGNGAATIFIGLRLRGRLVPGVLEASLAEVVRRHETLRTGFGVLDGEPVQVICPPEPVALSRVELGGLPTAAREGELRRLVDQEGVRPFDLRGGPLFRCTLVGVGAGEWGLLFAMHHIVSDGWSVGVLVREVSELYGALSEGRPSPLPELPVQYGDFAVWQRNFLSGETLQREVEWWRERLAGAPPTLELPTDRPRGAAPGPRGATASLRVAPGTVRGLRALARAEEATLFMLLLAGWQRLLACYAGVEDVSVGTPVAGRNRTEVEGLIGLFLNTLVIRLDLSGDPTVRALLGRAREAVFGAQQHQEVPFERIVEELKPERRLGHTPLFQVLFTLQNTERRALRLGEVEVGTDALTRTTTDTQFDLGLSLMEEGEELFGGLVYRTELFDAATAERMMEHFGVLLEGMAAGPERRISELGLLTGAERERVLHAWNDTAPPVEPGIPVHERFAEHARRTPEAVALLCEGGPLTYAELERRAGRLAARLRGLGVGPEVPVGLCAGGGAERVVGALGILAAGGAYLPLDPDYPAERLGWIVADARPPVIVTDGAGAERSAAVGGGAVRVRLALPADVVQAHP